jgi:tetratricopeptide (TPR) repeat protein
LLKGARFCVECGENLANYALAGPTAPTTVPASPTAPLGAPNDPSVTPVTAPAPSAPIAPADPAANSIMPFAAIFVAILAVGTVVAILIMRQLPARERLLASAPQAAPAASSVASVNGEQFPPGHPRLQLPKEALDFIANLQKKADANPKDLAVWDQLGDVLLRAATIVPSYYPRAAAAYAHVLKADPENLDALRGTGNIDFDQRKFDEAIAAYEHYLSRKPDDPDVRTDLGTMYLSTGNADQAVIQYRKVLAQHPQFFEAYFNLGVAYGQMNRLDDAKQAFDAAIKLAPDQDARDRVNQMVASLNASGAGGASAPAMNAASGGANAAPQTAAAGTPATFQGAMEQMLRNLPIAGPKVQAVQWSSATDARVMMDNFPMDQMPPFAAHKFLEDLKAGIEQVKSAHKISSPVQVNICDAASGRVMQTVTE